MANMDVTNVDNGAVELSHGEFRDEILNSAGAHTYLKGTLLARLLVALTITPSAVTGTGTGTCTAATVVAGDKVPIVGNYVLRCTAAAANGGTFRLEDPNGNIVATGLALTAGAGAATVFKTEGMQFTITDGGVDFAVGDTFTLPVVASNKLVAFSTTGAGGAQRPMAVLTYPITVAGAGDTPIRALIAGEVNSSRLVIDADGNGSNITSTILDTLKARGIVGRPVLQTAVLDNQ